MPPRTTLNEFIKNEELHRLETAWRRLDRWQKTALVIRACAAALWRTPLRLLDAHISRRRAVFAYLYPAHWIR